MNADILPRRLVLRRALAVACSLCLPIALSACDSKPDGGGSSPSGAAPASPPRNPGEASAATGAVKAKQAAVQYQAQPKREQKCGICRHFIAESKSCHLVEGPISPEAWCILWAKPA